MFQAPKEVFFFMLNDRGRECSTAFELVQKIMLSIIVNFRKVSHSVKSSCKLETLLAFQTLPRGERAPRAAVAVGQEGIGAARRQLAGEYTALLSASETLIKNHLPQQEDKIMGVLAIVVIIALIGTFPGV